MSIDIVDRFLPGSQLYQTELVMASCEWFFLLKMVHLDPISYLQFLHPLASQDTPALGWLEYPFVVDVGWVCHPCQEDPCFFAEIIYCFENGFILSSTVMTNENPSFLGSKKCKPLLCMQNIMLGRLAFSLHMTNASL